MANKFFNKVWSNAKDFGKLYIDNSLSAVGASNVIKDSDYDNNFWSEYSKVSNKIAPIAGSAALSAAGVPPQATQAIQQTGSSFNPQEPIDASQVSMNQLYTFNNPDLTGTSLPAAKCGGKLRSFSKGGSLTFYHGNPEVTDGITVADKFKADDGEVSFKRTDGSEYMFSNKLMNGKKSFASLAKTIDSKYKSNERFDKEAKQSELEKLANIQETLRNETEAQEYASGGSIHIKPKNRGKFTEYKQRTGKTTEEALHSPNAHVRQMANFARNFAYFTGGYIENSIHDIDEKEINRLQSLGYEIEYL